MEVALSGPPSGRYFEADTSRALQCASEPEMRAFSPFTRETETGREPSVAVPGPCDCGRVAHGVSAVSFAKHLV